MYKTYINIYSIKSNFVFFLQQICINFSELNTMITNTFISQVTLKELYIIIYQISKYKI